MRLINIVFFVFALAGSATTAWAGEKAAEVDADSLEAVITPYLTIQQALAADKTEGVAEAASKLATAARKAGLEEAAAGAEKIAGKDIKADREAFKTVSAPVVEKVLAAPALAAKYTVVHCSMAPGSWVQKGKDVRNPYYGASMLACGTIKNPK